MTQFTVLPCTTPDDRAAAMKIRMAVFVDEQGVPPDLEPDEYDAGATHLLARDGNGEAVGTARIVGKGDGVAKIGRVAVLPSYRQRGVGRALMVEALRVLHRDGFAQVFLDAQLPVIAFYEGLGFVAEGPVFDDAGIDHRRMTRRVIP